MSNYYGIEILFSANFEKVIFDPSFVSDSNVSLNIGDQFFGQYSENNLLSFLESLHGNEYVSYNESQKEYKKIEKRMITYLGYPGKRDFWRMPTISLSLEGDQSIMIDIAVPYKKSMSGRLCMGLSLISSKSNVGKDIKDLIISIPNLHNLYLEKSLDSCQKAYSTFLNSYNSETELHKKYKSLLEK